MPNKTTIPTKTRVISDAGVQAALSEAKRQQAIFLAKFDELEELISPSIREQRISALIGQSTDAGEIARARKALAEVRGDGARIAAERAKILARQALRPFESATETLVEAALEVANSLLSEALEAEASFFASFGLPPEGTSASRRVRGIIQTLENFQAGRDVLHPPRPVGRSSCKHLLAFFEQ